MSYTFSNIDNIRYSKIRFFADNIILYKQVASYHL